MKFREDDDPCVIDFIRRFYLFNENLPAQDLTSESSNAEKLNYKSSLLRNHKRIDIKNELPTTHYEERKVSQVVIKFMQSRGKKQVCFLEHQVYTKNITSYWNIFNSHQTQTNAFSF